MINYSIAMLGNPSQKEEPKRAYGVAQYAEKMTLEQFSEHISSHGCVYDADDVKAILGKAVKCLREMLLAGKKVELGSLGEFYISLQGKGADTAAEYSPALHVSKVNVVWAPGSRFANLKDEATFQLVPSRDEQKESIKKVKAAAPDGSGGGNGGGSKPEQGTETKPEQGTETKPEQGTETKPETKPDVSPDQGDGSEDD